LLSKIYHRAKTQAWTKASSGTNTIYAITTMSDFTVIEVLFESLSHETNFFLTSAGF
jgi:hypothetical protein